jgi:hypothetical protein
VCAVLVAYEDVMCDVLLRVPVVVASPHFITMMLAATKSKGCTVVECDGFASSLAAGIVRGCWMQQQQQQQRVCTVMACCLPCAFTSLILSCQSTVSCTLHPVTK